MNARILSSIPTQQVRDMTFGIHRRSFCAAAAGAAFAPGWLAATAAEGSSERRIYNAVKVSMIRGKMPLIDKFRLSKEVGFEGISLFAPDRFDAEEAIAARKATDLMIHNVNDAVHWRVRLSDADRKVREDALEALQATLRFAHRVGASSILLVVGKVTDAEHENHDQVWRRSIDGIGKALPLASRLGVRILCENVGNGFCEDPQQWADYLDEIGDPWVGAFMDLGNHHSKGGADQWVRTLGERIVKLDVKGHDSKVGKNCNVFEGDIDWSAVRRELHNLNFTGWATAEVQGGGRERLREVVQRMDRAMGRA